jgi:hypothetical protein
MEYISIGESPPNKTFEITLATPMKQIKLDENTEKPPVKDEEEDERYRGKIKPRENIAEIIVDDVIIHADRVKYIYGPRNEVVSHLECTFQLEEFVHQKSK